MEIGADKCGIMKFNGYYYDDIKNMKWRIQGKTVKSVQKYTYLGITINDKLDIRTIMKDRCTKIQGSLYAIAPVLQKECLPLDIRVRVFKATIIPLLNYGAELFGGMQDETERTLQKIMNDAVKMLLKININVNVNLDSALMELDIPPLIAINTPRRMRIASRELDDRNILYYLIQNISIYYGGRTSYLGTTYTQMGMFLTEADNFDGLVEVRNKLINSEKKGDYFKEFYDRREDERLISLKWFDCLYRNNSAFLPVYLKNGGPWNGIIYDVWAQNPELGMGLQTILQIRTYTWPNLFSSCERMSCSCYKAGTDRAIHYITECKRYTYERKRMLERLQDQSKRDGTLLRRLEDKIDLEVVAKLVLSRFDDKWNQSLPSKARNKTLDKYALPCRNTFSCKELCKIITRNAELKNADRKGKAIRFNNQSTKSKEYMKENIIPLGDLYTHKQFQKQLKSLGKKMIECHKPVPYVNGINRIQFDQTYITDLVGPTVTKISKEKRMLLCRIADSNLSCRADIFHQALMFVLTKTVAEFFCETQSSVSYIQNQGMKKRKVICDNELSDMDKNEEERKRIMELHDDIEAAGHYAVVLNNRKQSNPEIET